MVAMVVIGAVLLTALAKGFDGVLMASGISVIAGLGGYFTGRHKK